MQLRKLPHQLTVCKVDSVADIDLAASFYFIGKTEDELSLVCDTSDVPASTVEREDGWRGFVIEGVLNFSLIGILSKISSVLAEAGIGIFAVSTYNTDYVLVKQENFAKAANALAAAGYEIVE